MPPWVTPLSIGLPFLIGYARRAKPIGGWLFVYLWETALRGTAALIIGLLADPRSFLPGAWPSTGYYLAFLLARLPTVSLACAEAVVAIHGVRSSVRSVRTLERLRWILRAEVGAGLLAILVDIGFFPKNAPFSSIAAAIWLPIWVPYFSRSKRVARVYADATEN